MSRCWNDPTGKLIHDNYRLAPTASRAVQRVPAAHAATTITIGGRRREVYFLQEHPTGGPVRLHPLRGTQGVHTDSGILSHSGWRYAEVAAGETFLALPGIAECPLDGRRPPGAQRQYLGCHPRIAQQPRPALNDNYAALLDHYGLRSTRKHENGVVHAHYRLKDAIDQALCCGGSRDFHTTDDYPLRADGGETQSPGAGAGNGSWGPCPHPDAGIRQLPVVRRWCTIQVASYSVPSRLIWKCRSVWPTGRKCTTMERVRGEGEANVNYSHVIGPWCASPEPGYRGAAVSHHGDLRLRMARGACRRGVRADPAPGGHHHEATVDSARRCCWKRVSPSTTPRCGMAEPKVPEAPVLTLSGQPDLKIYDRLLTVSLVAAGVCA